MTDINYNCHHLLDKKYIPDSTTLILCIQSSPNFWRSWGEYSAFQIQYFRHVYENIQLNSRVFGKMWKVLHKSSPNSFEFMIVGILRQYFFSRRKLRCRLIMRFRGWKFEISIQMNASWALTFYDGTLCRLNDGQQAKVKQNLTGAREKWHKNNLRYTLSGTS